jgi:hypothetical protein
MKRTMGLSCRSRSAGQYRRVLPVRPAPLKRHADQVIEVAVSSIRFTITAGCEASEASPARSVSHLRRPERLRPRQLWIFLPLRRAVGAQEARVTVVQLVPDDAGEDAFTLVTTLPVRTLAQARAIIRLYAQRLAIETAFETMHAWGQDTFMVRAWQAINRLLWTLACTYALVALLLTSSHLQSLRRHAVALIRQFAVLGRHPTPGKLVEAAGLDYARHSRAWSTASFP